MITLITLMGLGLICIGVFGPAAPTVLVLGAALVSLVRGGNWLVGQQIEAEQAKYLPHQQAKHRLPPPAFPDPPGMAALTRLYMIGKIDVDTYTEAAEALPSFTRSKLSAETLDTTRPRV